MAFVSPRSLSELVVAALVPTALLLLGPGCKSSSDSGPPAITSAACMDPSMSVVITDPTNYTLTDSFVLQHVVLKDYDDLVFDWSQLTVDFFGQHINPATEVNTVSISLWNLTPSDIEHALKVDNLPLGSNSGVITTYPDGTYTHMDLLGFNELMQPLPVDQLWSRFNTATPNYQYPQDQYTFLLMAQSGTDLGRKPHGIALFNIDPGSTVTELDLTNDSTKLTYSDDLEQDFLNLENIADGWWSGAPPPGPTIDLSTLTDASGAAFPGIHGTGVWMAALFCGNCNNPAPWSITILQPCDK